MLLLLCNRGTITQFTTATNYHDPIDEVFILPVSMLEEEKTILTIELHRYTDETYFPNIKVVLMQLEGSESDCAQLNQYLNPVNESSGSTSVFVDAKFGFDGVYSTLWFLTNGPAYAIIRFKENHHAYFNQISFQQERVYGWYKITNFTFEVLDDNDNWNLIISETNYVLTKPYLGVFTNYTLSAMYSAIRFNSTDEGTGTRGVQDIGFHLCRIRFCESVGTDIPRTPAGISVNITCKTGSEYKTLTCNNARKPYWTETYNNCKDDIPSFIEYKSSYVFVAGEKYDEIKLFTASGKDLIFTVSMDLLGLVLDKNTGIISGQPYKEMEETSVDFTVSNNNHPNAATISIKIKIDPPTFPVIQWLNNTVEIDAGSDVNIKVCSIIGNNIIYSAKDLPDGLNINGENGYIYGMVISSDSKNITITATNKYGSVDCKVKINIIIPVNPTNPIHQEYLSVIYGMEYEKLQPFLCIAKTLEYKITPDLPSSLHYNKNTGIISGKVNTKPQNNITFVFNCKNENEIFIEKEVIIEVIESTNPLIISSKTSFEFVGGFEYYNESICEVTGKDLVYSIDEGINIYKHIYFIK